MTSGDLIIWIRGWEDTFTAAGRTREECHRWLAGRLVRFGVRDFRRFLQEAGIG